MAIPPLARGTPFPAVTCWFWSFILCVGWVCFKVDWIWGHSRSVVFDSSSRSRQCGYVMVATILMPFMFFCFYSSGSVILKKQQQQQQHFNNSNSIFHSHHHNNISNSAGSGGGSNRNNRAIKSHHDLVSQLDSSHTPTKFSTDNSAISSVVTSPTSSVRSKRMQSHQKQQQPSMQTPAAAPASSATSAASATSSVTAAAIVAASGGPLEEPKGAPRNNGHRVVSTTTDSLDPLHTNTSSKYYQYIME